MKPTTLSAEEYICRNKIVQVIFLFYVVAIIVQDFFLQVPLGTIARSPYIFLSPLVFVFITVISSKIYFEKETTYYFYYYFYSLLVGFFLIIYYVVLLGVDMRVYDENLVVKFLKSCIYNLIIMISLYNFIFIFKFSGLKFMEKVLKIVILSQLVVGYVQLVVPTAFDFLKTPGLRITERLSLLSTEPSHAFPQLLISLLCFLGIRYYNNNRFKALDILTLLGCFVLLIFIQSKGGLLNLIICFFLLILFSKTTLKGRIQLFVISLLFIIPVAWVVVNVLIPEFQSDMERDFGGFVSFSTRSVTILTALKSLYLYPFGQGYSTYLLTFPKLLNDTYNNALNWSPIPLSGFEIDWMLSTGRALTVKSGLLNETLYSGWAIIIFYILLFRKGFKRLKSLSNKNVPFLIFKFVLIFIIVNYLLVSTIETAYIAFLPFALLVKFSREAASAKQADQLALQ